MHVPGIVMQDDLGIVYVVENAQQFWSELEDIVEGVKDKPTLNLLDSALRRFVSLCATYHELYLQSPLQLEHATDLLLDSELFMFHSERMCEILLDDAKSNTDPHTLLIIFNTLHCFGRRHAPFFRTHKRWEPLIPLFMDHVLVETDPDVEDTYFGANPSAGTGSSSSHQFPSHSRSHSTSSLGGGVGMVPIEVKLRSMGVRMLYEICRVQKLSLQELRIFDDSFIDYLFNLVEDTRNMQDETFNYSVIKLIVALNEQFMVASISAEPSPPGATEGSSENKNRVLRILMSRLGSSKTFGENMIFMLNRADRTPEDQCMQLLVLKLLYLLFTTKGTNEYFYTNDLCVLVDVFLRELVDLDEESDSLRHTYLRVLHPLLTKTQLQSLPYKRPQIVCALESLISNSSYRDVCPTTKRLVERCLSGDWCVQLRAPSSAAGTSSTFSLKGSTLLNKAGGPSSLDTTVTTGLPTTQSGESSPGSEGAAAVAQIPPGLTRQSSIKTRKSVEDLPGSSGGGGGVSGLPMVLPASKVLGVLGRVRRTSNASATSAASFNGVAGATAPTSSGSGTTMARKDKVGSMSENGGARVAYGQRQLNLSSGSGPGTMSVPSSPTLFQQLPSTTGGQPSSQPSTPRKTSPPPPPPTPSRLKMMANAPALIPSPLQNANSQNTLLTGPGGIKAQTSSSSSGGSGSGHRRAPPAPPVKTRRKPPAVPARRGSDEVRMTTIKTTSGVGVGVGVA